MATIACDFDDNNHADASEGTSPQSSPLALMKTVIGDCFCAPMGGRADQNSSATHFIELHGIEFIGLGAVTDELSPKERVYDTLEQLTERTERLISIGHLVDDEHTMRGKSVESIPLDIWNQSGSHDRTISRQLKRTIAMIKERDFANAMKIFTRDYESQKRRPAVNGNVSLLGITAHNMGVVCILAGRDGESISYFREAVDLKKAAFGEEHPEVAVSLDELGIQLFAAEKFGEALSVFNESKRILSKLDETSHFRLCMLLNNISCCTFQMGNALAASGLMHEARELQRERSARSSAKIDLDLLYLAILANNYGYLKAQLKDYEEARALFEEAMLIQQSIFPDEHKHRAIRDSRSNLDFVNAFHS